MDETGDETNKQLTDAERQIPLLNQRDGIADFEKHNPSDTIHCEYETSPAPPSADSIQDDSQISTQHDWKRNRPPCCISWFKSFTCSFYTTMIGGVSLGIIATSVMWLDLNLAETCFNYNDRWYEMPIKVRRIRLTTQVFEGIIVQLWSLTCILAIFGWPLVKELNLLNWNMLVAFMDGMYRLFLDVYGQYNTKWMSYPLNLMFAILTLFNGYRVARYHSSNMKQSISLAIRLGGQFYMCAPIAWIINYCVIPYYKTLPEDRKAILASFIPAALIVPKALERVFAGGIKRINHPGTSVILLVPMYTASAIIFRVLQARLEGFSLYFILRIVHGLESTVDKLTLPFRDYLYHKCCKERAQNAKQYRTPRVNRLHADLALLSMIVESGSIFLSCAIVEILRYYYGRDNFGNRYEGLALFKSFIWRVSVGIIIEWIFNVLTIKIQTFYYNIPVVKVWKFRWRWIMSMIVLNTIIAILWFPEMLYSPVISRDDLVDPKMSQKCVLPFQRA